MSEWHGQDCRPGWAWEGKSGWRGLVREVDWSVGSGGVWIVADRSGPARFVRVARLGGTREGAACREREGMSGRGLSAGHGWARCVGVARQGTRRHGLSARSGMGRPGLVCRVGPGRAGSARLTRVLAWSVGVTWGGAARLVGMGRAGPARLVGTGMGWFVGEERLVAEWGGLSMLVRHGLSVRLGRARQVGEGRIGEKGAGLACRRGREWTGLTRPGRSGW